MKASTRVSQEYVLFSEVDLDVKETLSMYPFCLSLHVPLSLNAAILLKTHRKLRFIKAKRLVQGHLST